MAFKIKDGVSVGTVEVFDNSGALLVNAPTATKWQNSRTITLTGAVTGTVNGVDGSADVSITTDIAADAVALGIDTTGNYVATITGSDGITVTGSGVETAAISITHSDTSALTGLYGGSGISSITVDDKGHVTAVTTASYLSSFSESDTLQSVTERTNGNTTDRAITISNSTASSNATTGALIVSGGVGIGGYLNVAQNVTVGGNLVVNGTTTTVESTTITLKDPILSLGDNTLTVADPKYRGIEFKHGTAGPGQKIGFFGWNRITGKFTFIPDAINDNETFTGTTGEIDAKIAYANILNTPTIGNGKLDLAIGAQGNTNTSVTVGGTIESTGFTANTTTDYIYKIRVGPALENLVALMTGTSTGRIQKTGQDTYSLDTTTFLTQAVTTFSTGNTGLLATGEGQSTPVNTPVYGNVVLSGTLDLDNGGTGATDAVGARTNLGGTTLGGNLFTVPNVSGLAAEEKRFIRINADNTVTLLSPNDFKTAIGANFELTINTNNGITGGPVQGSGTYTFGLTSTPLSLYNLSTTGIVVRTGADTVVTRELVAGTGIQITNGDGVSGNITISSNLTFTEVDTLDSVTGRGDTTANAVKAGTLGLVSAAQAVQALTTVKDVSVGGTLSAVEIDTWNTGTYRSAKYFYQITQGTNYESGEVIVLHNGSTAKITHYGVLESSSALTAATAFTAAISGNTLSFKIVMAGTATASIRLVRTLIAN
jgi:hypothetical protein